MMKLDTLDACTDVELTTLIKTAETMLARRKEQRRKEAIQSARAKLAEVGLTFGDLASERAPGDKTAVIPKGQRFVNPANPDQVWVSGRGRRPGWMETLEPSVPPARPDVK
jgi:DNA-binding protein H-NS